LPTVSYILSLHDALPILVKVPAGSFEMGESGSEGNEEPVHRVTIAQPFYLSNTEITFAKYDAFQKASGRDHPDDRDWGRGNQPVDRKSTRLNSSHDQISY